MTPTYQSDLFLFALTELDNRQYARRMSREWRSKFRNYQVVITDFDKEEQILEVDAMSCSEAAEEAERIFQGDIYNMCIYDVTGL